MEFIIIICLLIVICVLQAVLLVKTKTNYTKLKQSLEQLNATEYKYRNIFSMVEYYIRNYKEGENPFTVLRDITNLVYRTGDKQYEGKEDRT